MVQFLMWDVQGACSLALHSPSLRCSRVSFQGRNLLTISPDVRSTCGPSQQFPVYDVRKASVVSLILSSFLLSNTVCSLLLGTSSQRLPLYPSSHTACSIQKAFPSGKRHWTGLASSATTWPEWGPSPAFPWQGSFIISQLVALFYFSWLSS